MGSWTKRLELLKFAFQPVVNIHTGSPYGYEALLRGYEEVGFCSIDEVFDTAFREGVLHGVDLKLREKAISAFTQAQLHNNAHLFYNLDNRTLISDDYQSGKTLELLQKYGMENRFCFEISERHELKYDRALNCLSRYRDQGFTIAVDDYGTGFSGIQLLYYTEPDFIKIDRFFIQDISTDRKKKHFVAGLLSNAHMLGSVVIAEGVETTKEFFECFDVGCDLVQGALIQTPQTDLSQLRQHYEEVSDLAKNNRRKKVSDRSIIAAEMEYIEPVRVDGDLFEVFQRFQQSDKFPFFPVVNQLDEPIGVVRESDFKKYAYSRFGRELLQNRASYERLMGFVHRVPTADCHAPAERILDLFSLNKDVECILITDQRRYVGLLDAKSLLRIIYEKNLTIARDQNPLTKLPGNSCIFEFVSAGLERTDSPCSFAYFDFDKFKPYNDRYGFRQGDRVIMRFAEILKEGSHASLIGHVGGDDFFLGYEICDPLTVRETVRNLQQRFAVDVESFYDPEDLQKGCIHARTRSGEWAEIPIMRVSAGVLHLPHSRSVISHEVFSNVLAYSKKKAKHSTDGYWETTLDENSDAAFFDTDERSHREPSLA